MMDKDAPGGTRTPNLLIRSQFRMEHLLPGTVLREWMRRRGSALTRPESATDSHNNSHNRVDVPHAIDRISLRLQLLVPGLLCGVFLLAGCESSRPIDGKKEPCVGINDGKDSTLVYEYSARNIIVGLLTAEFIAPPVIVILNELECPKRRKP